MGAIDSKSYLRKAKEALDKYRRAQHKYEAVLARVSALHASIRPLISDLTAPDRDKDKPPILRADYSIPLKSGVLTIGRDTPPGELKKRIEDILNELDMVGGDIEAVQKDLEGRYRFLQSISSKEGSSK